MRITVKILLAVVLTIYTTRPCYADVIDTLRLVDDYDAGVCFKLPTAQSRRALASCKRHGTITTQIEWPTNKSDEWKTMVQTSIDLATETWENYLYNDSISVKIIFNDNLSHDVETDVYYCTDQGVAYPYCLYRKKLGLNTSNNDGEIRINSASEWKIGIGADNVLKNLPLAIMRSICNIIGFGSTVIKQGSPRRPIITTISTVYSQYDNLIVASDSMFLNEIPTTNYNANNSVLKNFVEGSHGDLYVVGDNSNYKLYAPSVFDTNASLRFFDGYSSLMSYQLPDSIDLSVDGMTIEILDKIGWKINQPVNLEIVGENIDSSGVTSAYQSHRFYVNNNLSLSEYNWRLELPLASGGSEIAYTSTTSDFTIPAFTNVDSYKHTKDGQLKGHIVLEGILNNEDIQADYYVTFELKPKILSASIVNFTPLGDDYYDIDIAVSYEGSYHVYATAEYGYNTVQNYFVSYQPYYSQLHLTDIDFWDSVLIRLKVSNIYGHDYYFFEWDSNGNIVQSRSNLTNVTEMPNESKKIEVYDITGQRITCADNMKDAIRICPKGRPYILRVEEKDRNFYYKKYIKN